MESPIYHLEGVIKEKSDGTGDFTGPLDLILYLLSKNKMEIKDIQISLILEQYLKWLEERKELNLEIASEFVSMASHLIYIKTRMLLSIHDEEAHGEMEQLIAALEAHQRHEKYEKIKAVIHQMEDRYYSGQRFMTKDPEVLHTSQDYCYEHTKDELLKTILSVLSRSSYKLPPPVTAFEGIVGREPYPIEEKAEEILKQVMSGEITKLSDLFVGRENRSEVVAVFIAVLELCKARRLCVTESGNEPLVTYIQESEDIPLEITTEKVV